MTNLDLFFGLQSAGKSKYLLVSIKNLAESKPINLFFFHLVKRKIVPYLKVKKSKIAFVSIEKLLYWLNLNRACQNHIWEVIQNSRYNNASAVNPGLKESKNEKAFSPTGWLSNHPFILRPRFLQFLEIWFEKSGSRNLVRE